MGQTLGANIWDVGSGGSSSGGNVKMNVQRVGLSSAVRRASVASGSQRKKREQEVQQQEKKARGRRGELPPFGERELELELYTYDPFGRFLPSSWFPAQDEMQVDGQVCVCFVSFTHHRKTSSICISHSLSQHNSPN